MTFTHLHRTRPAFSLLIGLACLAASFSGSGQTSGLVFPPGRYLAGPEVVAQLTLTQLPDGRYRIRLEGGGLPSDGAAIAADCEAVAEGRRTGTVIEARLVPFEGETVSLTQKQIDHLDAAVSLTWTASSIEVRGRFGHCGARSRLSGSYRPATPK